ncbi:transposase [Streptomyces sp. NPDC056160]|uniref:transposase n=1 Tax=Streptomyces sp. NPDC056160 TaxID=3345731 RepID=UPI0035E2A07C
MPKRVGAGRPPVWPRRRLIDGIRFRVRTGVPGRDVPVEYGPWGRATTCSAGGSGTAPGTGFPPGSSLSGSVIQSAEMPGLL